MNVLFLTLVSFDTVQAREIYTDLLREFIKDGHEVYSISPVEKHEEKETYLIREDYATILRIQIGDIQKTSTIKKGINTVLIGQTFKKAIKTYFSDVKFDLVLYSTPPITLAPAIEYVKTRDGARTYLLLKDIFPQNAVDLGMLSTHGVKGLLYKYFRRQEKRLYAISDRIGCMSPANVKYVIDHNPEVDPAKVEVCPNSIEVIDKSVDEETRTAIRNKYGIPLDKRVFVYGGNLGKPQGIPFLIECLRECEGIGGAFFLIVGDGTEFHLINDYVERESPKNVKLMRRLPKEDYDTLVAACDVGMIFLDHRFTIPNFPSRLLSYMQAKLPVFACTDPNTDIGQVIVDGEFGWWVESDETLKFRNKIGEIIHNDSIEIKSKQSFNYLVDSYDIKDVYSVIYGNGMR